MGIRSSIKPLAQGLLVVAILAVGSGVFFWLRATRPAPERREIGRQGLLVEVARAEAGATTMTVSGFGTVESRARLTLTAQVGGEVVEVSPLLRDGAFFRRGEPLIRIDPRPYELAVAQLEALTAQNAAELRRLDQEKANAAASLALVEDEVRLAQLEVDRKRELARTDSVSQAALEQAEQIFVAARGRRQLVANLLASWPAQRAAAEALAAQRAAQLAEARLRLEFATIAAPMDGRATARLVEVGQYVAPGSPLATVHDADALEVTTRLPLDDAQWIDLAALIPGGGGDDRARPRATIRLRVGGGEAAWPAEVARVEGEIDRVTRQVGLVVEVANAPRALAAAAGGEAVLAPGMFVEVDIEGRAVEGVFALPRGVIDEDSRVWVFTDGRLASRAVTVLRAEGGQAWVRGGLAPGELVVVSPLAAPVEGMTARLATDPVAEAPAKQANGAGEAAR